MNNKDPKLELPKEQLNSALSECITTLVFALNLIGVELVDSTQTIRCDGNKYEVSIIAKKIKE